MSCLLGIYVRSIPFETFKDDCFKGLSSQPRNPPAKLIAKAALRTSTYLLVESHSNKNLLQSSCVNTLAFFTVSPFRYADTILPILGNFCNEVIDESMYLG